MRKHSPATKVHRPALREHLTLNLAPRPERMPHTSPWLRRIRTKCGRAVLTDLEPRRRAREFQIDNAALVQRALDMVHRPILTQLHAAIRRMEVLLIFREVELVQIVRGPELRLAGIETGYLCIELCCRADAHHITVYDLCHANLAVVAHHVEGLRLHIRAVYHVPRQIFPL